jgi:hypothetical protein
MFFLGLISILMVHSVAVDKVTLLLKKLGCKISDYCKLKLEIIFPSITTTGFTV